MFSPRLASAVLGLAFLSLGSVASAADDAMMPHDAMAKPATMATYVCRPAAAGEKATAMTTATNTALVCKPIDTTAVMAMKKTIEAGPNGGLDWQHLMDGFNIGAVYR